VVGSSYQAFIKRVQLGEDPQTVLDDLGLTRYCCRRMIVAHADLVDEIIPLG
jgi:DNA-directed RNA polymerase subunit N